MKIVKYSTILGLVALAALAGCKNFEEINKDPNVAQEDQVRVEYFLNKSIYEAQMNPDIAERVFIIYWNRAARYERAGGSGGSGLTVMNPSNDYSSNYWNNYSWQWIKNADLAVNIGTKRLEANKVDANMINVVQIARIWRAYLYSELADNFGPIPRSKALQGTDVPLTFDNVEEVYKFILAELKDASAKINLDLPRISDLNKYDQVYAGDLSKWQKYANSMRLRYAMRLSGAAPELAREHFEEAVKLPLITTGDQMAAVQEKGGWDPTTGVMTRAWNWQTVALTMNNISFGLGGVDVSEMTNVKGLAVTGLNDATIAQYAKNPTQYLGVQLPNHLSDKTNVMTSGYLFDAIPQVADPRLFKNYNLPGFDDGVVSKFTGANIADSSTLQISKAEPKKKLKLRAKYTWSGLGFGEWNEKAALFSGFTSSNQNMPSRSKRWCDNERKRVFFAPWETYFLIAEAAVYGWDTNGMSDATAYENGIRASFEYMELSQLVDRYIASQSYNMVGTSVNYGHTSEASNYPINYVNLNGNLEAHPSTSAETAEGVTVETIKKNPALTTVTYNYPKGLYATNNDKLTKIITQKWIAQCPWLPLEAWSDYRRLGLPFQENPLLEKGIVHMGWYTDYTKADIKNSPARLAYPQSLQTNNQEGYNSGVAALGGPDNAQTPLWWAKK